MVNINEEAFLRYAVAALDDVFGEYKMQIDNLKTRKDINA